MVINCCNYPEDLKGNCIREIDNKKFPMPRKYSKKYCLSNKKKGYTQKSSCAPFKGCKKIKKNEKTFFYNNNNPKLSFDVYIDKNPNDTIPIKYKTLTDVKNTIDKLEKLYKNKKYTHKRIWQVAMIMKVRLNVIKKKFPHVKEINKRVNLATKYYNFLKKRTKLSKSKRYIFNFNLN